MVTSLLTRDDIKNAIDGILHGASDAIFAVAFWGKGSENIFRNLNLNSINIQVICNLTMGGTNPQAIDSLRSLNIPVLQNDKLHSKIYYTDKGCIIGSANASVNGLALEGIELDGWIETCVLMSSDEPATRQVKEWLLGLRATSRTILDHDMEAAMNSWTSKRNSNPVSSKKSFIEQIMSHSLTDRKIMVGVYRDKNLTPSGSKKFEQIEEEFKNSGVDTNKLGCYEDWDGLKLDWEVVDIYFGKRKAVCYGGIYNIIQSDIKFKGDDNEMHSLTVGMSRGKNKYFTWGKNDQEVLKRLLCDNESKWFGDENGAILLDIGDLQEMLAKL